MPKPFRAVLLALSLVVTLTAARGADDFDLRYLLATVGVGLTVASAQHLWNRDRYTAKWQGMVDVALWGPEDPTGKRNVEAGVVAGVARLDSKVDAMDAKLDAIIAAAEIAKMIATQNADTLAERRRSKEDR